MICSNRSTPDRANTKICSNRSTPDRANSKICTNRSTPVRANTFWGICKKSHPKCNWFNIIPQTNLSYQNGSPFLRNWL